VRREERREVDLKDTFPPTLGRAELNSAVTRASGKAHMNGAIINDIST
jgi:hypothetical protein